MKSKYMNSNIQRVVTIIRKCEQNTGDQFSVTKGPDLSHGLKEVDFQVK